MNLEEHKAALEQYEETARSISRLRRVMKNDPNAEWFAYPGMAGGVQVIIPAEIMAPLLRDHIATLERQAREMADKLGIEVDA